MRIIYVVRTLRCVNTSKGDTRVELPKILSSTPSIRALFHAASGGAESMQARTSARSKLCSCTSEAPWASECHSHLLSPVKSIGVLDTRASSCNSKTSLRRGHSCESSRSKIKLTGLLSEDRTFERLARTLLSAEEANRRVGGTALGCRRGTNSLSSSSILYFKVGRRTSRSLTRRH